MVDHGTTGRRLAAVRQDATRAPARRGRHRRPTGGRHAAAGVARSGLGRLVGVGLLAPLSPVPRRYSALLGCGLPAVVTMAAMLAWVRGGAFIAVGDVAPFELENTAAELTSLWNHQLVGTGSTSLGITRVPEVALVRLFGLLGWSAVSAQYVFYALVWGYAAFGGAYLASTWIRRVWPVAVAGLIAAFNPFLLVSQPNPIPALAIGTTGVLVGMVLRAGMARRPRAATFAVATLPASYLSQNPPLLAVLIMAVCCAAVLARVVVGEGATARALALLARAAPLTVLLSLWWLVPFVITMREMPGVELAAQTDVVAWSWTHARSSIANVVALNSHWGWENLDYFPFRPAVEAGWRGTLRWCLPALAIAGVLLARGRHQRVAWLVGAGCLGCVVVGTGLHEPFGSMNRWLYDHVPGMWLLRDPAMKLSVCLVLGYGVLAAVALERVLAARGAVGARLGARVAAGALVVAAVGYPWPLWTGAVVGDHKPTLPGSHVRIPPAWYEAAAAVNASAAPGKVLVLPLDPFYQVTTGWGYHGIDMIPTQLISRPVVNHLPGLYFQAGGSAVALMEGAQAALLAGERDIAAADLRALGIGQVIVRHDLVATSSDTLAPPASSAALSAAAGAVLVRTGRYGVADVYRVPGAAGLVTAYHSVTSVSGGDRGGYGGVAVSRGAVPADADAMAGDEAVWRPGGGETLALRTSGRYRLSQGSEASAFRAEVLTRKRTSTLRLTRVGTVAVDGVELPAGSSVEQPLRPGAEMFAVNGRLMAVSPVTGNVQLTLRNTLTQYRVDPQLGVEDLSPVGDCARSDEEDPRISSERPDQSTLRLSALSHSACVSAALPQRPDEALYLIEVDHRRHSGREPRLCLWRESAGRCLDVGELSSGPGWRTSRFTVRIAPADGPVSLFLYADGDGDHRTVVDYRDLRVDLLRPLSETAFGMPDAPAVERDLAAGEHSITARRDTPAVRLSGPSELGNCYDTTGRPPVERGLRMEDLDGVLRLSAPVDIACATFATAETTSQRYRLELEYRAVAGRAPRICLWQVGPDRCAALPRLSIGSGWMRLSTSFQPEAGTRFLRLFLYADGQRSPRTVAEYRDPSITPDFSPVVRVERVTRPDPAPTLAVAQRGTAEFQVSARAATGRFALVLAEAAAPGWRLTGLPEGWSARPFTAYGYSQAWLVAGTGDASLTIVYGPSRRAEVARYASLAAGALLVAWRLAVLSHGVAVIRRH